MARERLTETAAGLAAMRDRRGAVHRELGDAYARLEAAHAQLLSAWAHHPDATLDELAEHSEHRAAVVEYEKADRAVASLSRTFDGIVRGVSDLRPSRQ